MADELAYHDEQDIKNIAKTRELQKQLPDFAKSFFLGISQRTATRTSVAYAYDLITFFKYLENNTTIFKEIGYKDAPVSILDSIKATQIEEYLSYLRFYTTTNEKGEEQQHVNKANGIKRKLSTLKTFYRYYFRKEMIFTNPTEMVDMPKLTNKPIVRMEANEVADLLDHVENGTQLTNKQLSYHDKTQVRDMAIVSLMLGTGIRVSECVGLNVADIDLTETCAKIFRKGGKEAVVYFSDEVVEYLIPYLEQRKKLVPKQGHENALFLSMQMKRMSVRAVEQMVKKYTRTVTTIKKITPHKLRSTFGTALYQETKDIYLVASVLGHSDVNTTKTHYADIETQQKRSARNIVKLRED